MIAMAEAEQQKLHKEGAGRAAAVEAEGRAEAAKVEAIGLAQAKAIEAQGIAEATAILKKAEAWKQFNDAARLQTILEKLPAIIQSSSSVFGAVAAPLGNIDKVVVIDQGGGARQRRRVRPRAPRAHEPDDGLQPAAATRSAGDQPANAAAEHGEDGGDDTAGREAVGRQAGGPADGRAGSSRTRIGRRRSRTTGRALRRLQSGTAPHPGRSQPGRLLPADEQSWNFSPSRTEYPQEASNQESMSGSPATDRLSDEVLVQRTAAGDRDAFAALYRRRRPEVFRFAVHMTADRSVAEDVVQDVFMTVMQEAERFEAGRAAVAAWLCGIARNRLRQRLARDRRLEPLAHDEEAPDWPAAAAEVLTGLLRVERVEAVRRAVLSLPLRYREAVVLCDLQELLLRGRRGRTVVRGRHREIAAAPRPRAAGVQAVGRATARRTSARRRVRMLRRRGCRPSRVWSPRGGVMKWERELDDALRELARSADEVPENPATEQHLLEAFEDRQTGKHGRLRAERSGEPRRRGAEAGGLPHVRWRRPTPWRRPPCRRGMVPRGCGEPGAAGGRRLVGAVAAAGRNAGPGSADPGGACRRDGTSGRAIGRRDRGGTSGGGTAGGRESGELAPFAHGGPR